MYIAGEFIIGHLCISQKGPVSSQNKADFKVQKIKFEFSGYEGIYFQYIFFFKKNIDILCLDDSDSKNKKSIQRNFFIKKYFSYKNIEKLIQDFNYKSRGNTCFINL